jgi:hypothetical protein
MKKLLILAAIAALTAVSACSTSGGGGSTTTTTVDPSYLAPGCYYSGMTAPPPYDPGPWEFKFNGPIDTVDNAVMEENGGGDCSGDGHGTYNPYPSTIIYATSDADATAECASLGLGNLNWGELSLQIDPALVNFWECQSSAWPF